MPPCPVERLICFAPANFGSDLALLGQSFLSKFRTTFFNSHSQAEDAFETGKVLLQGLEPASPFQWELSMYDLHNKQTYFSSDRPKHRRCYPFVLSAGTGYTGLQAKLIKQRAKPGTDGTVRIPGTSLNTRMCTLDFPDNAPAELYWYPEVKFDEYFQTSFYQHSVDSSCRVMLVNCNRLEEFSQLLEGKMARLMIQVNGISSLPDVKYQPQTFEVYDPTKDYDIYFLCSNTTTLVDIVLNREQSDRMLSIKDSELIPIKGLKKATESRTLLGGRAGLL